jgi:hypothetical protein
MDSSYFKRAIYTHLKFGRACMPRTLEQRPGARLDAKRRFKACFLRRPTKIGPTLALPTVPSFVPTTKPYRV